MRTKYIFSLLVLLSISAVFASCDDSIQSGLNKQLKGADKVKVYFFAPGETTIKDSTMIVTINRKEEIEKLISTISDESTDQFKCGYSGYMDLYEKNIVIQSIEFNYDAECAHYVFRFKTQIYYKAMTEEGQKLLKALNPKK